MIVCFALRIWVFVGVFFMLKGEIVHGVVFVKSAILHTLHHLHRIQVVLPVDYLHNSILQDDIFTFEIDEMRMSWLIGQTELACPQVP